MGTCTVSVYKSQTCRLLPTAYEQCLLDMVETDDTFGLCMCINLRHVWPES